MIRLKNEYFPSDQLQVLLPPQDMMILIYDALERLWSN